MNKKRRIINCTHRNIIALNVFKVKCCECDIELDKEEWKRINKDVLDKELKWLLQDDTCKHTSITNIGGKALCLDCQKSFEFDEWLLYREPYNLMREAYHKYTKSELEIFVIRLREKLEKAHKELEIDHVFVFQNQKAANDNGVGEEDWVSECLVQENISLEKRDDRINGIFCRDTKIELVKQDFRNMYKAFSKAIEKLKSLGVDTTEYEEYDED